MSVALLPDALPALRSRLLAVPALAALVTGGDVASGSAAVVRVYAGRLPRQPIMRVGVPGAVAPALVLSSNGGPTHPFLPFMATMRVELRAYHAEDALAMTLWYAAYNALLVRPATATGVWAEPNQGLLPRIGEEPGSGFLAAIGMLVVSVIGNVSA